jgi:hypothetical protein
MQYVNEVILDVKFEEVYSSMYGAKRKIKWLLVMISLYTHSSISHYQPCAIICFLSSESQPG